MSETPMLDGPRYGPVAGGAAQQLMILLHGVGADGKDLIELAPHLGQIFPNAAFVAPNAPNRYDQAFRATNGFQRHPRRGRSGRGGKGRSGYIERVHR